MKYCSLRHTKHYMASENILLGCVFVNWMEKHSASKKRILCSIEESPMFRFIYLCNINQQILKRSDCYTKLWQTTRPLSKMICWSSWQQKSISCTGWTQTMHFCSLSCFFFASPKWTPFACFLASRSDCT